MAKPLSREDLRRRQLAIDKGRNSYEREDGSRYTIRNRNNPRHRNTYGGQGGRDELSASRKGNRGGGGQGSRARFERFSTSPGTNRRAFGAAMAAANAAGMDGDHINGVARTGRGYQEKAMRRRLKMAGRFASIGSATGNHANNVQPLTPDQNQRQKPADQRALDNKLKEMNQRPRPPRRPNPGSITGPKAVSNSIRIPRTWIPPVQDHVNHGVPNKPITNGVSRTAALSRAVDMINKAQPKFFQHPGSIPIYIP